MAEARHIRVERLVRSDPGELFGFLSDLENHWLLADRFIDVLELDAHAPARGGRVRMRGPLGMRRTALTRVLEVVPETRIAGTAEIGARTLAHVSWMLFGVDGGTHVVLAARVERASLLDRVLLAAGGALWMRRRTKMILAGLDGHVRRDARAPAEAAG
jgi:uncharacterized protein YndB with AHSA1/START domain